MSERTNYEKMVQAKVEEYDARIDELSARARRTKARAKQEYLRQVEALQEQRDALKAKYEALKKSGAEAWQDLRVGVDGALREIKGAFESVKARFKE